MFSEKTIPPRLILILGGARSGKSTFAERLATSSGRTAGSAGSVAFIATATADDDEMRARIARHRASRPREWHTIEEPLDLAGAVRQAYKLADVLLLDCVTLWLGNMLTQESGQRESDDKEKEELRITSNLFDERPLKQIEDASHCGAICGAKQNAHSCHERSWPWRCPGLSSRTSLPRYPWICQSAPCAGC